ncbi:MAG: hypothetical protein HYX51_00125 [Chloroflexi bacterium]|nr:hypothetical protein [Chloroflexota bacterium]
MKARRMALWLDKLFRRREPRPEDDVAGSWLDTWASSLDAPAAPRPAPKPAPAPAGARVQAVASAPVRNSVWERLAGDPGAQALRSQWEARWDEF